LNNLRTGRRKRRAALGEAVYTVCQAEPLERRVLLSGLTTVASFDPPNVGANPFSAPIADSAGNLYVTTSVGGVYNDGAVFEWTKSTNSVAIVASFNGADGANPFGLVFDGSGDLFGATSAGGSQNDGTVFEILAGSNSIDTLASFNQVLGEPGGGVTLDGAGDIFGVTFNGGVGGWGTVFEVLKGSGEATTVASFDQANGQGPQGELVMDSHGNLFGAASTGGANNEGTVYEIASGSNAIQTIASFNNAQSDGEGPSNITLDGNGNLYGTAEYGGINGLQQGTLYEIAAGTNTITVLAAFNDPSGYAIPVAAPIMDKAGNLYGTTTYGGTGGWGTVYELAKGSNSITTLASFNLLNGQDPQGLTMDKNGNLYGSASNGGPGSIDSRGAGLGTLFELAHGSNSITVLYALAGPGANQPDGIQVVDNGNLYGLSDAGGSSNQGAIYEVPAGTNTVATLASFTATQDGSVYPDAGLVLGADGNLYGATKAGGTYGDGTVFDFDPATNTITTIASFNGANGSAPSGGIALDTGGDIFGTASQGGSGIGGTIWEIAAGTNTIAVLASFDAYDEPTGAIAMDSLGDIYGSTFQGGANNIGEIFELAHGSSAITTLASFSDPYPEDDFNGSYSGVVMDQQGDLFGTINSSYNTDGTVFELAKGSNTISTLISFNVVNGANPVSPLVVDAAGNIFGTVPQLGLNIGGGVFEIPQGTNTITTLANFGIFPYSSPTGLTIDAHGNLYGAVNIGGTNGVGDVFELPSAATVAPAVSSFTVNGGAAQRSMVTQATVVFNQPVKLASAALSLVRQATGGGSPTPVAFDFSSPDGGTTWNLTFPAGIGGSLADGAYIFTVTAADVTGSSSGVAMSGGNQLFAFDRLFGDADGNGTVNNADYFQFKNAFGKSSGSPGYNPIFDYDANGIVNNADYFQFKERFGQTIVAATQMPDSATVALLGNSDSQSKGRIGGQVLSA
jgi:uncharacterized repeat protein (TIGR03803 family)